MGVQRERGERMTVESQEPNYCPACRSDDISYADTFHDGAILVSCGDCDAKWYELWTYAGIMMVEGEMKQ